MSILTTYEFMFEKFENGIRFVLWRDFYSDGERELFDIIEKTAPLRADKIARDIFKSIEDRLNLEYVRIVEADTKTVVFEKFDADDTLQRACLLDFFTNSIKTEIKEKRNE